MIKEFKKFALRGNILDLAVGVIIGGAFGKIVTSLVNDIIMPAIGALLGGINFTDLKIIIKPASEGVAEAAIMYGSFIQSVVDFLIIAFSIFFMIKALTAVKKKKEEPTVDTPPAPQEPIISQDIALLTEIRDLLKEKENISGAEAIGEIEQKL